MLTVAPHLRTRRPSPTTVEYTVSTSPPLTVPLRLLILLTFLFRLVVGLNILLLLWSKYLLSTSTTLSPITPAPSHLSPILYSRYLLTNLHYSPLGALQTTIATHAPLFLLAPLSLLLLHALTLRIHTTESLLVIRGLGIQTSTSSSTYLSTATTRFIPTEKIQDVLINEAFRGFEVRYYLVVVVGGEEEVVVVFPGLLPRRGIVEAVWRGARGVLWEGRERGKSAGE